MRNHLLLLALCISATLITGCAATSKSFNKPNVGDYEKQLDFNKCKSDAYSVWPSMIDYSPLMVSDLKTSAISFIPSASDLNSGARKNYIVDCMIRRGYSY